MIMLLARTLDCCLRVAISLTILKLKRLQGATVPQLNDENIINNVAIQPEMLEAVSDGWWLLDIESQKEYLSPNFKAHLGYQDNEIPNTMEGWQMLIFPEDLKSAMALYEEHIKSDGKTPYVLEARYRHKDGHTIWVICRGQLIHDSKQNARYMLGIHTDITKLKSMEEKLADKVLELNLVHQATSIVTEAASFENALQRCIDLVCQLTRWDVGHVYLPDESELVPSDIWFVSDEEGFTEFKDATESYVFKMGIGLPGRVWKSAQPIWVEDTFEDENFPRVRQCTKIKLHGAMAFPIIVYGRIVAILEFFSSSIKPVDNDLIGIYQIMGEQVGRVLERKRVEEQLESLAHFDSTTGLANRAYFLETLARTIKRAERTDKIFGILFFDLDNFKTINDTLGHLCGDALLKEVARRVHDVVREYDFSARYGGDEFVVLIDEIESEDYVAQVARRLLNALKFPMYIEHNEIIITVSVGISIYPHAGTTAEVLLKHADIAMYRSKKAGKDTFFFYKPELKQDNKRIFNIEEQLKHAIDHEEFSVVYQPLMNKKEGDLLGVEALLRWHNEKLGDISPAEFIPIAEASGKMFDIGEWIFKKACHQFSHWTKINESIQFSLSINCSVQQLIYKQFDVLIKDLLEEYHVPSHSLVFELTSTEMLDKSETVLMAIQRLNNIGLKIAMDNFGMGYASFHCLKNLPVSILKIGRSYIEDLDADPKNEKIISAIIELGKILNLEVIVQGVETKEQYDFLKSLHCDYLQGNYLAEPMSADEITQMILGQKK